MYKLNLTDETFETLSEAEDALYNWVCDNQDDIIDEDYPDGIEIYGMNYCASTILKECDPVAYRCIALDIADGMYDYIEEIEEENN